jgi:hypothetical protein
MKSAIASLKTQALSAALLGALVTNNVEALSQASLIDPDLATFRRKIRRLLPRAVSHN